MRLKNIIKNIKLIPIEIFNELKTKNKRIEYKINNKKIKFKYLGSGGSSIIYRINKKYVLKICIKIHSKDLFFLKLLEPSIHLLKIYADFILYEHLFIIESIADNTLDKWIQKEHTNKEWIMMLLQIYYMIHILQTKYMIYHGDMTFRNIMYKKLKKNITINININENTNIIFETDIIFIIIDFGRAQSIIYNSIYKPNVNTHEEIIEAIKKNYDNKYILFLHKKYFVNKIIEKYENNNEFINYYKKKYNINNFRQIAYYLVEENIITFDEPNKEIQNIISNNNTMNSKIIELNKLLQ